MKVSISKCQSEENHTVVSCYIVNLKGVLRNQSHVYDGALSKNS